ncbi:MAG: sugar ABC transporter substrate-binding protein [Lachnospiraceae bacterium]|nr:sugar ABC transporter substrate-binding protein [Lachnospiraceae bacterium]
MKRRLVAFTLCLAMVISMLAGCSSKSAEPSVTGGNGASAEAEEHKEAGEADKEDSDELYFVYVSPLLSHPIWLLAKDGFDSACKELGVEGDWVGPQGISAEEMAQLVDTATAQNADGIITQGICPAEPVQAAVDEGIAVLTVDSDIASVDGRLAHLGKDINRQAELMYEEACKYISDDEKIVLSIQCVALNTDFYVDSNSAVIAAFENHPGGFELANISASNGDKAVGINEWLNTFNTYPEINVCVGLSADAAAGCITASDELEITDDLIVFGVDDTEENMDLLKEGKIKGTVVVSFWNYGYQAAYWLYQNITEGRVPEQKINDAGTMMVTTENMDNYAELLKVKVDLPE